MNTLAQRGFTLIEVVVVIVVLGILGFMSVAFVTYSVQGYSAQSNRATLVDDTTTALSRMARDIRAALPNSVRVNANHHAIEMLHVCAGGRYRSGPGSSGANTYDTPAAWLQFDTADAAFNILGPLAHCQPSATHAVIFNVGITEADAYAVGGSPNVITPPGTTFSFSASGPETHVTLSTPFQFKYTSPGQRIYFINTPVSWVCDPASGTLRRYSGYAIQATQAIPGAHYGALASDDVAGCAFAYMSGTARRNGLATLALTLTRNGESVHLLEQVHVVNDP